MKFKTFIAIALVVMLSLVVTPVVSAADVGPTGVDDTAGVFLYCAGTSAGTADAPTGVAGAAVTNDIVTNAINYGVLEFVGDVPEEVDSFSIGTNAESTGPVDASLADVVEGLTTVDDFGLLDDGDDDAANFDVGTGGCFVGGLRAIPSVRDALVIVPDGTPAIGMMGPSVVGDADAAEAALDGCEIFIFDDAELSGMVITLSSPSNNIVIEIDDRQIDPYTADGADDTLIAIDLDLLEDEGLFDGTYIDTISVCDDGIVMTGAPLFPAMSLEIDAIATRSLVRYQGTGTPGYWKNHPDAWPVDEITIGGVSYTKEEAIALMKEDDKKDKTLTMFNALVAAKLNVLIGNDDSCIADTIIAADAWMEDYGPAGIGVKAGGKNSPWREGEPLSLELDRYNNGQLCAPSRG